MKKSLVLLLTLVVLILGTAYYVQGELLKEKDQVNYTEKVLYGDKSVVDGVTIDANVSYDYHLFWNTVYEIGTTPKQETEYTFYLAMFQDYQYENAGYVNFNIEFTDMGTGFYWQNDYKYHGMEMAVKELFDSTEPGTEKEATVYLKDYADYYTFMPEISLPACSYEEYRPYIENAYAYHEALLGDIKSLEEFGTTKEDQEQLEKLKRYLKEVDFYREFFKIPVLENEVYNIRVGKTEDGVLTGIGASGATGGYSVGDMGIPDAPQVDGADSFNFYTHTVMDQGDAYFTFDPYTYNGNPVDTSQIPGGYGIYHFTYDTKSRKSDYESMKMVYALDTNRHIYSIEMDEGKKNILLVTTDDTCYYMSIIDRETMTLVDEFVLGSADTYLSVWCFEDYIVLNSENIQVYELGENNRYTCALSTNCQEIRAKIAEVSPEMSFLNWDTAFDWNGETLLVSNSLIYVDEYGRGDYTCDFYVAAINDMGLLYYGEYASSLRSAYSGFYDTCRFNPDMKNPIQISWN